jgi:PAS domain S-box-containing protein
MVNEMSHKHQVAFGNLITRISTNFINLSPQEIDAGIDRALRDVGRFMEVDRSYVFLFSDDKTMMDNTHEWCAEGIEPQTRRMQDVPVEALSWSNEILMRGEVLHIPCVDELPPEASAERVEFQSQSTRSLIATPMVYQGETIGLLGFDGVRAEKKWSEGDVKLLKTLGAIFVNALERKRADEALRESRRMLSTLISNLPGMAYRCRDDTTWTMEFVSEGSLELTGYRPEELVRNQEIAYGQLIHPADKAAVQEEVQAALGERRHFEITYRLVTPEGEKWVWERGQGVHGSDGKLTAIEGFITDITERVMARQNLERRVAERTRELATLLEISHNVASTLELEPLLGLTLDHVGEVVAYDVASIMILDEGALKIVAYRGPVSHEEAMELSFSLDEATANWAVIQRREPLIIEDVSLDEPLAQALRETTGEELEATDDYVRAWMGVPLMVKERVVGMLSLNHNQPGYYTAEHADLAMAFANQVAVAIDNARLYEAEQERLEESERRRRAAEGLRDVLAILNSDLSLDEILNYIIDQACRLLGSEAGVAYQIALDEGAIEIEAACDMPDGFLDIGSLPLIEAESNRAILKGRPFAVADLQARLADVDEEALSALPSVWAWREIVGEHFRSYLSVPIVINDQVYGAISLFYDQSRRFSSEEIDLAVTLADQAALAIENARLRVEAEKSAAAAERSRLARDLHDAVTQTLFSSSLIADVLPRIWEINPEEGRRRLEELRELTRGALAEMRTLLLELRPAALADAELSNLLKQLAESITGRARVPVSVEVMGDRNLPDEVKVAFYRIAQESLNNVAKHADATQATVSLVCGHEEFRLSVSDNGCGFDPESLPPDSLGLGIMRERAEAIGATLTIASQVGRGTEIEVKWKDSASRGGNEKL